MDNATFTALVALGTALATGMGVKFFDFLIALRKGKDGMEEKKFDDGVARRQEMIQEITYLREVIKNKDSEILEHQKNFESLRKEFFDLSINYTKLQGDYRDVVEKLEELKVSFVAKVDEKKAEIIKSVNDVSSTQPPLPPAH